MEKGSEQDVKNLFTGQKPVRNTNKKPRSRDTRREIAVSGVPKRAKNRIRRTLRKTPKKKKVQRVVTKRLKEERLETGTKKYRMGEKTENRPT